MPSQRKIRLGVNIDHCATLRQVRGGTTAYPDLQNMVQLAKLGGADQITIHLREDRRHIQDEDVAKLCRSRVLPINLEMAVTLEMQKIALRHKPDWVCFVPEKREELTTEGGLDVIRLQKDLSRRTERLQRIGIEVSMFIEPDLDQVRASFRAGADAVEFHTGKWVMLGGAKRQREWKRLRAAAELAHDLGMNVHAGHGLDVHSTAEIRALPFLEEVNIGHSIVCEALEFGLSESVRRLRRVLSRKGR